MKTADAMRELLRNQSQFGSTTVCNDSFITAEIQNADVGILQLLRKYAVRVKGFGDGYLVTALMDEAINKVIHNTPKVTLQARAIRYHKDAPDELLGRDLARTRAKRKDLYMKAKILEQLVIVFSNLTIVIAMALNEVDTRARDAEQLENAILLVSHNRPRYPREKLDVVVTIEKDEEASPETSQASADS